MKWHKDKNVNNSSNHSAKLIATITNFVVAFAGTTRKAPPAQANMLQDIVDNMLCVNGIQSNKL